MRRMLSLPNHPAVFSMHMFSFWWSKSEVQGPDPARFYLTGEDDMALIAQYYDVPALSVRWIAAAGSSTASGWVRPACIAWHLSNRSPFSSASTALLSLQKCRNF